MPKLNDQVRVTVQDLGTEGGKRKLTIEVEAYAGLLLLSEALSKEGAVKDLAAELRTCVRKGVLEHVQRTKDLVRKLGSNDEQ